MSTGAVGCYNWHQQFGGPKPPSEVRMDIRAQMKLFLEPRTVAVVGAPRRLGDGSNIFENLINYYCFSGKVYPVNPNAEEIAGIKAYPSIKDVPDDVDLAVIVTPRDTVPPLVRECVEKGIRAIIVTAQGFADSDEEGKRLQAEVVSIARGGEARVIGPNAFGVGNAFNMLCTAFIRCELHKIPLATVAQTGLFFDGLPQFPVIGKSIDVGNACDIDFSDTLEYFEDDPEVRVIALHIEGIRDGRRFVQVASRVSRKKPILALKGGRSEQGFKLTQSHSGSLAGSDEVYEAMFRQCGIIRVEDTEELADVARAFLRLPPMRGGGLGVITIPMSCGVMAADACDRYGLHMAQLMPQTKRRLGEMFPSWGEAINPVDLVPPGMISRLGLVEAFRRIMHIVLEDETVDAILFIAPVLPTQEQVYDFSSVATAAASSAQKPIVCWLIGPDHDRAGELRYEEGGQVTFFRSCERAVRALARLRQYHQFLEANPED